MKQVLALLVALALGGCTLAGTIPVDGYRIVHTYPHDTQAYTEGLLWHDGYFYEATGRIGHSSARKVDPATGKVVQQVTTPERAYGEGIAIWKSNLIQLTWQRHHGFIYDLGTLTPAATFDYPGEGWALTRHDNRIYMSDGTPTIRILDADTLRKVGAIEVTADGKPVKNVNELEWVKGQIYANIWLTNRIARIDPITGNVVGWIDLTGLAPAPNTLQDPENDVLNGIAYDARDDRLFVTGKCWPHVYQITLVTH